VTEISLPYFVARPAALPPWRGLVVIHEGNGISPQLLRFCQRLAGEGYAAVAPDLFFRAGGTEAGGFAELMGSMDPDETLGDLIASREILEAMGASRVGVTGFCMGGSLAYRTALAGAGFGAAVGFYGAGIANELGTPACPTLLFFGGDDPWVPAADIEKVAAHHSDTVVYPQATHGFMRDGSDSYDADAAEDAWKRTLDFFGQHLGGGV